MRTIRYTSRAAKKLLALRDDSIDRFGAEAAASYMAGLRNALELLAKVRLGTQVRDRPDVRRWRQASHWIYYRWSETHDELVVLDIRGEAQLPP